MSDERDHIVLANINHDALMYLLKDHDRFPEWISTVAFYKAVQIVEAVIANNLRMHSMSHEDRRKTLQMERFRSIHRDYLPLLTASRIARYLEDSATAVHSFRAWRTADSVKTELVEGRLRHLEQNCLQFLSESAKTDLKKV